MKKKPVTLPPFYMHQLVICHQAPREIISHNENYVQKQMRMIKW